MNNIQDQQTWADTAATLSAYVNGDGLPFTHEGYIKNGELYAELEETVRKLAEAEKAAEAEKLEASEQGVTEKNNADDEEHKTGGFGRILKTAYWGLTTVALFSLFVAATFAWFSSNSIVNTDKVTGNTSTDTVELLISSTGIGNFQPGKEANLVQVNASSSELLMPVS